MLKPLQPRTITKHTEELGVKERLQLLTILPTEGDAITLRIIQDLRRELSFTEEETERFQIVANGQTVNWNRELEIPKAVEMGPKALGLIRERLSELSESKKLLLDYLPLYEHFVSGE